VATDTDRSNGTGVAVLPVLLAACAGSADVFAFFGSKNTPAHWHYSPCAGR
jgi:uncharacterized membrane protein YoaK (UPF0700 family)